MSARSLFFGAAAAYLVLPGAPDGWLRGVPLGLWPFAALAIGAALWWQFRKEDVTPPALWHRGLACLVMLAALKVALAVSAFPVGWAGSYYANAEFTGPPRQSTDFPGLAATRIDRRVDFHDDYLPAYFLNEAGFNRGIRREVTDPLSVRWVGYVAPADGTSLALTLAAKGHATVSIDGRIAVETSTPAGNAANVSLDPGGHEIRVDYVKPADTDPLIKLTGLEPGNAIGLSVTPVAVAPWHRTFARVGTFVARATDACALLVFAVAVVFSLRRQQLLERRLTAVLAPAMLALLIVQGVQAAAPMQYRALTLSGGDDWLAYEARAREVETGGLLMSFGKPLFTGDAFYYYPGYSYFLAAVHKIAGEDLSGPIFAHFLLLFLTNVIVFRTARAVFDERTAVGAVILLVVIEEIAFIRHYTIILLSENLYVFTVAWTIAALVGFIGTGRRSRLVSAGLAAGISSLVRPVMMLYFVPAVAIVLLAAHRHRPNAWGTLRIGLLFVACWLGAASLATLRNWLVAGNPVFIVISPAHQFILDNLPANGQAYMRLYTDGLGSAIHVLGRIALEHPVELLRGTAIKLGFSLGWLQIMGGNAHPELLAVSVGYLLAIIALPAARAFATWPIHAFVLAHLAGMVLRMPTLYGYRLILPMYLFFPMFASAMIVEAARRISLVPRVGHA